MRIVLLLARSTGGIGTHVDDLARELRVLGHDVVIATDELTADTFAWTDARLVWPAGARGGPSAVTALRRILRGADVVHGHGHQAGALAALAVRALPRSERPALVVSLHNAVLGGARRRLLGSATAALFTRTAQLVTGASTDLVEQARSWGAAWSELAPVPSPRVPELLARPSRSPADRRAAARPLLESAGVDASAGPDLVLTIARIAPQKDLMTLVAAAAADRATSTGSRVWVVVGGGEDDLATAVRGEALRLRAPVHLVGPRRDPTPWLEAATAFVLTSHWEARALVVQEAMAAGVPVVARDTGGLRDLVRGVGTLVGGSDPGDWAAAVTDLVDDGAAWAAASDAGRAVAASWDDGARTATRWVSRYARARVMT